MHFTVSTKQFRLTDKEKSHIVRYVKKLVQFTPWKEADYPLLDIILRKHKRNVDHPEKNPVSENSVRPVKGHEEVDNPIYYDGTLDLILPKKRLVAKMLGRTVHEALKDGFEELFRELDTYKGLYFAEDSEYFDHRTIRGR